MNEKKTYGRRVLSLQFRYLQRCGGHLEGSVFVFCFFFPSYVSQSCPSVFPLSFRFVVVSPGREGLVGWEGRADNQSKGRKRERNPYCKRTWKKKTKTKQERSVPRASLPSTCWLPFFFSFSSLGTRMGSVGQQRTNKPKSNKKTKIRVSLRKGRVVGFAFGSSSSLADFVRFVFRFFVSPLCACSCV